MSNPKNDPFAPLQSGSSLYHGHFIADAFLINTVEVSNKEKTNMSYSITFLIAAEAQGYIFVRNAENGAISQKRENRWHYVYFFS